MRNIILSVIVIAGLGLGGCAMGSYEAIYPRTAPGVVEVKQIPARTTLMTAGQGDPMQARDENFRKLFGYIKRNDLAMTVPVETDANGKRMKFFVGSKDAGKRLEPEGGVQVQTQEPITVVSAGMRGSYTLERFGEGARMIREWMAQHPEWSAAGEPYAVYWNAPFVPGFLKKSEVHQEIRRK